MSDNANADLKSMLSGRTGKSNSSKYTTGGKGILQYYSVNLIE